MQLGRIGLAVLAAVAPATFSQPVEVLPDTGTTTSVGDPYLTSVLCPFDRLCLARSQGGRVVVSTAPANATAPKRPDGTSTAWSTPIRVGVTGDFACPSPTLCLIGGSINTGRVRFHNPEFVPAVAIARPSAAGITSWRRVLLPELPTSYRRGRHQEGMAAFACPSARLCLGLGSSNNDGDVRMWRSTDPGASRSAWSVRKARELGQHDRTFVGGISCPSSRLCVVGLSAGRVGILMHPESASARWKMTRMRDIGGDATVGGHAFTPSCPSERLCVAPLSLGSKTAVSVSPRDGAKSFKVFRVPGRRGDRISCSTETFCAITGGDGKGFTAWTTTDPAAGPAAWTPIGPVFGRRTPTSKLACAPTRLCVAVSASSVSVLGG
jgi:hypothetical protein